MIIRRASVTLAIALAVTSPASVFAQRAGFDVTSTYVVPIGNAPSRGAADAPVTIVEFSDFRCGYCIRAQRRLRELSRIFGAKLRFVFRHNPLDLEDGSLAAEATYAARAQGKFWQLHDRLFASRRRVTRDMVEGFAQELGLNLPRFRRDLDSRTHLEAVKRDAKLARLLGATSTPMFFINGRPVRGLQHLSVFAKVIRQELARAAKLVATGVTPKQLYVATIARGRVSATPGLKDNMYRPARLVPLQLYRVSLSTRSHRKGSDDALVTIVEFSDFECGFCKRAQPVLRALRRRYGKQLRFVYRHMPLRFHRHAQLAAEASLAAAAQHKFWQFHDALFASDRTLTRANLDQMARKLGLDMKAFGRALDTRKYYAAVLADALAGSLIGVDGTPTFFINGTPVSGAKSFKVFKAVIDAKLVEAKALLAIGIKPADVYRTVLKRAGVVEPKL